MLYNVFPTICFHTKMNFAVTVNSDDIRKSEYRNVLIMQLFIKSIDFKNFVKECITLSEGKKEQT